MGHAGFITEQDIAKEIEELDVVVGGHTNTFLYNGKESFLNFILQKHFLNQQSCPRPDESNQLQSHNPIGGEGYGYA